MSVIVHLSSIGSFVHEQRSVPSNESVEFEIAEGLAFVVLAVSSENAPASIRETLENPLPEIADRINHRRMITTSRNNRLFQIFGGPIQDEAEENWMKLFICSTYDSFNDFPRIRALPETKNKDASAGDKALRFAKNNKTALIAGTACAAAGALFLPVALPLLGFTVSGIAAGSVAASAQSFFYGAFTGGIFSVFQSMGAVGVSAGVTATMAMFGFATGAGIGKLVQAEIIHQIPVFHRITGETRILVDHPLFRNLRSITILIREDGNGTRRIGFICSFTRSNQIYRYRFQFSRARFDFELQVPRVTGEEWQEFIWLDFANFDGQQLEYVYVLKPRQKKEDK